MRKKTSAGEAVEILKPVFPKVSEPIISMARQPEKYGIELTKEAKKILKKGGIKL